jgi:cytochrome c-type biogenesis protein CcmH
MRALVFTLLVLLAGLVPATYGPPAHAVAVDVDALANPALDQRARVIARQLRCLVCQNQSIEDSNADLAKDLRQLVRDRLIAGDTDEQAIAYIVARYGDWVLLNPPLKSSTMALWLAPFVIAGLGLAAIILRGRRRDPARADQTLAALSPDEAARLKQMVDGP